MFCNIAMSVFRDVAKDFRLLNKPEELVPKLTRIYVHKAGFTVLYSL